MQSTLFGVSLAILGTLATALGNHIIQKSHHDKTLKPYRRAQLFYAGNALVAAVGTVLGLFALSFVPQSLVSPLGGMTLVWNLALARLPTFGGSKPNSNESWGTVVALLGTAMAVWFGPHAVEGYENSFLVFRKPVLVGLILSMLMGVLGLSEANHSSVQRKRIAAASVGGLMGGLSNVFAKSAVDFYAGNHVESEKDRMGAFILVIGIALVAAVTQLMFLNRALAAYSAVQVVPVYQTVLILAATASGGVAFDEFEEFTNFQFVQFFVAVILCVAGVALIASNPSHTSTIQDGSSDAMKD